MNNLYTIVDESGKKRPYRRRWTQQDLAHNKHGLDVVLKSRQHGISSESDIDMLDDCVFTPDLRCGIIAHTKLDAQEIFETKVKLPYFELPEFIRKKNPHVKCDGCKLELANGSSIRVAVSFRSATTHRLHVSELGKICAKYPKRAAEIKTGTMPSVHPQLGGKAIIEGTAEGPSGDFHTLCIQAQSDTAEAKKKGIPLNALQYKFHFYAWFQDPKNTIDFEGVKISDELKRYFEDVLKKGIELSPGQQAWYAMKKDGAGGLGRLMKREHPSTPQEAFEQSVEGAIFGEQMEKAYSDGRIGFYPYIEKLPVDTFWDLGYHHATSVMFTQYYGEQVRIIDHHNERGRGAVYHAKVVKDKPYIYGHHYFPHDVMNHEKGSGIVLFDTYQSLLKKGCEVIARPKLKLDSIQSAYLIFPQVVFHAKTTEALRASLSFYRYEWDEETGQFGKVPVDDPAADDADVFQLMSMQYRISTVDGPLQDWDDVKSGGSNATTRKHAWNAPKKGRG
jgi:hypothetical protein